MRRALRFGAIEQVRCGPDYALGTMHFGPRDPGPHLNVGFRRVARAEVVRGGVEQRGRGRGAGAVLGHVLHQVRTQRRLRAEDARIVRQVPGDAPIVQLAGDALGVVVSLLVLVDGLQLLQVEHLVGLGPLGIVLVGFLGQASLFEEFRGRGPVFLGLGQLLFRRQCLRSLCTPRLFFTVEGQGDLSVKLGQVGRVGLFATRLDGDRLQEEFALVGVVARLTIHVGHFGQDANADRVLQRELQQRGNLCDGVGQSVLRMMRYRQRPHGDQIRFGGFVIGSRRNARCEAISQHRCPPHEQVPGVGGLARVVLRLLQLGQPAEHFDFPGQIDQPQTLGNGKAGADVPCLGHGVLPCFVRAAQGQGALPAAPPRHRPAPGRSFAGRGGFAAGRAAADRLAAAPPRWPPPRPCRIAPTPGTRGPITSGCAMRRRRGPASVAPRLPWSTDPWRLAAGRG